jgi:rare lipoprotein A
MKHQLIALALGFSLLLPEIAEAGNTFATWYGPGFHGRRMANGKRFNQNAMTAAHPSLRLGTRIRVRYKRRSVVVRVTDRCRCSLDLSKAAFRRLAPLSKGRIKVRYSRI